MRYQHEGSFKVCSAPGAHPVPCRKETQIMITLSTRSRYGTRLLMALARHRGENPVQIADIARDQGISAKYLEQIALALKRAGMIETVRGRGGGHRLAKHPDEITLDEVVAVLEGGKSLVRCLDQPSPCARASRCAPRLVWQEISQTIFHKLSLYTLGDLLRMEDRLMDQAHEVKEDQPTTFYCPSLPLALM